MQMLIWSCFAEAGRAVKAPGILSKPRRDADFAASERGVSMQVPNSLG
jgi:hypothetical protein